jgi:hypothetical protein
MTKKKVGGTLYPFKFHKAGLQSRIHKEQAQHTARNRQAEPVEAVPKKEDGYDEEGAKREFEHSGLTRRIHTTGYVLVGIVWQAQGALLREAIQRLKLLTEDLPCCSHIHGKFPGTARKSTGILIMIPGTR